MIQLERIAPAFQSVPQMPSKAIKCYRCNVQMAEMTLDQHVTLQQLPKYGYKTTESGLIISCSKCQRKYLVTRIA